MRYYYVTGSGANIAKYIVDDYIYDVPIEFRSVHEENLWLVVPEDVAFEYIRSQKYKDKMRELINAGKYVNPLIYDKDNGFMRRLRIKKNMRRHYRNYKTYMAK